MPQEQAQGSTTRILFDREDTYKTPRSYGSRKPRRLPINTSGLMKDRSLNTGVTLRGRRNPISPWRGSIDVAGQLLIPLDRINIGFWLTALLGEPTTVASSPSDIKTGSPKITISSGIATLTVAQTSWQIGDRISYTVSATTVYAYIKTINSTTEAIIVDEEGFDTIADVSTGSDIDVVDIKRIIYTHTFKIKDCENIPSFEIELSDCSQDIPTYELYKGLKASIMTLNTVGDGDEYTITIDTVGASYQKSKDVSNGGNVTITSGEAEFTVPQSADIAVGDLLIYDTDYKKAYVTAITDTDTMTVKTQRGGSTNPADVTGVAVQAFLRYADYAGGGQDEIIELMFDRYEMEDAAISEGGNTSEIVRSFTINYDNSLETGNYVIAGGGIRRSIPNGVAAVGAEFEALFENDTWLDYAEDRTETSFVLTLTHPDTESSIVFTIPECQIAESTPDVPGPQGRIHSANIFGFDDDNADDTAFKVVLTNIHPTYAY